MGETHRELVVWYDTLHCKPFQRPSPLIQGLQARRLDTRLSMSTIGNREAAKKLQNHLQITADVAHMLLHAGFPTIQSVGTSTPYAIALRLSALADTDPVKLHDNLPLIRRIILLASIERSTYASGAMGEIDLLTREELERYGISEEDDFDNLTGHQMQRKMRKPRGGTLQDVSEEISSGKG